MAVEINKADSAKIIFWNRSTSCYEIEKVYGDAQIRWVYETTLGKKLADFVLSKAWISRLYGVYQSSPLSQRKIRPFIRAFDIRLEEFEDGPFLSFNEFFIRKFKLGSRPFVQAQKRMAAFAEARYLAFEKILPGQKFPVKGKFLSAEAILTRASWAEHFAGGPLLLARLCPTDYHRFHFPDSGRVVESFRLSGPLHSVNPVALQAKNEILATNERQVTILETENFGTLAFVEVGALCVGKIVQTHSDFSKFKRGDEKGYFLFGGSTVIVLGQPGKWKPEYDLLEQTQAGRETLVKLGESVASAS